MSQAVASHTVVTFNVGSSNLKYSAWALPNFTCQLQGKIEFSRTRPMLKALEECIELIQNQSSTATIDVIGHRVVHGGDHFIEPTLITDEIIKELHQLDPLAPLHLPAELSAIEHMMTLLPGIPHIACFDTAFHASYKEVARRFGIPSKLHAEGVKRYGFHGLSYQYLASMLSHIIPLRSREKVIAVHLGNGASACAMLNGKSVDSTMGFTALDGLMMGTRCGSLDPGVVLHLCHDKNMATEDVQNLLYKQSGLLGVSGISNDMRELLVSSSDSARQAIELFCYQAAKQISALLPSLGGLDAIIFTAGIGEHCPEIRQNICEHLSWLGIILDDNSNQSNAGEISTFHSQVGIYVAPTNEEKMIAKLASDILPPHDDAVKPKSNHRAGRHPPLY